MKFQQELWFFPKTKTMQKLAILKEEETVPFLLQSRRILSIEIKHYTVTSLSIFIWENSLRLPGDWIENRLFLYILCECLWVMLAISFGLTIMSQNCWISCFKVILYNPLVSEASKEVANLTERKNPHAPVYGVKEFVCLLPNLTPIVSGLTKQMKAFYWWLFRTSLN